MIYLIPNLQLSNRFEQNKQALIRIANQISRTPFKNEMAINRSKILPLIKSINPTKYKSMAENLQFIDQIRRMILKHLKSDDIDCESKFHETHALLQLYPSFRQRKKAKNEMEILDSNKHLDEK